MDRKDLLSKLLAKLDKYEAVVDELEAVPRFKKVLDLFYSTTLDQDYEVFLLTKKYEEKICVLEKRILELENRFLKNSRNSSKPPSSDGINKPKRTQSLREVTGRKPGGQLGHEGSTLEWTEKPDEIINHERRICSNCGTPLRLGWDLGFEARQVVDLKAGRRNVVEHRVLKKCCSRCNSEMRGDFPEDVTASVQYGKEVKALALYFILYQLIPYQRTAEIFFDLWSISISQGTLVTMVLRADGQLKDWENQIKASLINQKVVGFDETGIRCEKKLMWLHVARSETATLYFVHQNRGTPAFEDIGVLPDFKGTAIHDGLKSYFEFTACRHGLCNAHHLRELKYIQQTCTYAWPEQMAKFLCDTKDAVASRETLSLDFRSQIDKKYNQLLKSAYKEIGDPAEWKKGKWRVGKRRRHQKQIKQDPERLLLNRLRDYRKAVLAFAKNKEIPFTNNGSERDIRMAKLKQKISGSFRSQAGAESFCRLRSFISTNQKNNITVFESLKKVA